MLHLSKCLYRQCNNGLLNICRRHDIVLSIKYCACILRSVFRLLKEFHCTQSAQTHVTTITTLPTVLLLLLLLLFSLALQPSVVNGLLVTRGFLITQNDAPHSVGLLIYIYITATGLTPGGSSTAHIYTQTVHRIQRKEHT
jgi:hypothetical protein